MSLLYCTLEYDLENNGTIESFIEAVGDKNS